MGKRTVELIALSIQLATTIGVKPNMLTDKQKAVAETLREYRPNVLPGTNVIARTRALDKWYRLVTAAGNGMQVPKGLDWKEFSDLAGVPD